MARTGTGGSIRRLRGCALSDQGLVGNLEPAEQDGQGGLHASAELALVGPVRLGAFGFLIRRVQFLHVLGRIFFEIFQARFAAEFHFLALVSEDVGITHFPQFLVGNDADFEGVGFGLAGLVVALGVGRAEEGGESDLDRQRGDRQNFREFHNFIRS